MMLRSSIARNRIRILIFVGAVVFMLAYFMFRGSSIEIEIPDFQRLDLKKYPDLGITLVEEFPTDGPVRIEKNIHQTWKTTDVPHHYVDWVKTWTKNHHDWKYMFWTDASAHKLISDKYSHLLPAYDMYLENIRRADAMRYIILHEYGGVYVDLDMESLSSLNSIVRKYSCILPQEPYEHPIIDSNFEHLVINAFMACRSGHPLMKRFLETLPKFAHMWNVLDSTGPHYATFVYHDYMDNSKLKPLDENGVYLAPAEYFFPTIDPTKFSYMKERCYRQFESMSHIQKRACVSLKLKGLKRSPYPYSFTDHHWVHTYFINKVSIHGPVSIFDIVPRAILYK